MTALFGALYTLAKEKINDTAGVAMLAIWVDFLMIFTLILEPEYPWAVNYKLWCARCRTGQPSKGVRRTRRCLPAAAAAGAAARTRGGLC